MIRVIPGACIPLHKFWQTVNSIFTAKFCGINWIRTKWSDISIYDCEPYRTQNILCKENIEHKAQVWTLSVINRNWDSYGSTHWWPLSFPVWSLLFYSTHLWPLPFFSHLKLSFFILNTGDHHLFAYEGAFSNHDYFQQAALSFSI